jgi:hypothetical protein
MKTFFFRHVPTPVGHPDPLWPEFSAPESETDPTPIFQVLHREADPDAPTHDGFDYFAAYAPESEVQEWLASSSFELIDKEELPAPVSYLPAQFL